MTCNDCIHNWICYRIGMTDITYADKCGDFELNKDREFYQSELIKCLEQIKDEIRTLYSQYGDGNGYAEYRNMALNDVMKIIDKRLDKAKKIKEM